MADFDPDSFLDKLGSGQAAPQAAPSSGFDPDQFLGKLEAAPSSPGSSPDAAIPRSLYGEVARTAGSFGDDAGRASLLASQGFHSARRNQTGDLTFQHADGKWYKDADNFFRPESGVAGYLPDHPINWAESHFGKALPMTGMMVGGALGAGSGLADAGATSIPGAMAGAGAGAGAGELARQAIGRYEGTYTGDALDSAKDVGAEAAVGALGEGIARPLEPVVAPAMRAAGDLVKGGVSRASSLMTGVPKEAIERLIDRPSQVMGADAPGSALGVAQKARQELLERDQTEDAAIRGARDRFKEQFGGQKVDTRPMIENQDEFVGRNAPNESGVGPLSPEEVDNLGSLKRRGLVSEVRSTPLNNVKSNFSNPETQQIVKPSINPYRSTDVPVTAVEPPTLQWGKSGETLEKATPEKSAADLQKFADYLSNEVKRFDQSKLPGTGDTRFQAYMRGLYGQVKDALHTMDPEGLGAADKRFTEYAQNAGRLGRLEDPDQMEGFINNFYGKNKTLMRQSAQGLIPGSVEDIADLGANRAFTTQGPAGSEMGRRAIGGALAGLGVYEGTHNPILAGATAVSTSPQVHKAVIGTASKILDAPWFQAIRQNPVLLESIANPELKEQIGRLLQQAGPMPLPQAADNGSPKRGISGQ